MAHILIFILVHKFFNPFQHWRLASEIQFFPQFPIENDNGESGVLGSGSLEGTNCKKKLFKISLKLEKIEEKYHTGNVVKIALGMTLPIFKPGLG